MHAAENGPAKAAGHFPSAFGNLCRSGYVFFWLRGHISKFEICHIKKCIVLAEITKFNAHQIFPLYSIMRTFSLQVTSSFWSKIR